MNTNHDGRDLEARTQAQAAKLETFARSVEVNAAALARKDALLRQAEGFVTDSIRNVFHNWPSDHLARAHTLIAAIRAELSGEQK